MHRVQIMLCGYSVGTPQHNQPGLPAGYQRFGWFMAGYQLVARDQLVTRLVRRLVVRVISRYLV